MPLDSPLRMLSTRTSQFWPLSIAGATTDTATIAGFCELRLGDILIIPQHEIGGPISGVRPPPARSNGLDLRGPQRFGWIARFRALELPVEALEERTCVIGSRPACRHYPGRAGRQPSSSHAHQTSPRPRHRDAGTAAA